MIRHDSAGGRAGRPPFPWRTIMQKTKEQMTAEEFCLRLTQIKEQTEALRERAEAFEDQQMSQLFVECRWTQQQIANEVGKTQHWVCYRLRFGRFLGFITTVINPKIPKNLTERRFRSYWEQTEKGTKEQTRFRHVFDMMQEEFALITERKPSRNTILEECADWKWRTKEELGEILGKSPELAARCMRQLKQTGKGIRIEKKGNIGTGSGMTEKWRLKKVRAIKQSASFESFVDELEEILKEALKFTLHSNQIEYSRKMAAGVIQKALKAIKRLYD
jgi:hypothetical protein